MKNKTLLFGLVFLLLLSSISFAAFTWREAGALAIMTALSILLVLYMVGRGFSLQELELSSKEELTQVLVAMFMLIVFALSDFGLNSFSQSFGSGGLQNIAKEIVKADVQELSDHLDDVHVLEQVSIEGSRVLSCAIFSLSFTYTSCGGYSALSAPVSSTQTIISIAIVELNALKAIIDLGAGNAVTILLPLGLVFRSFKVTRSIGAMLFALAVTLYLVLPITVVFANELYEKYSVPVAGSAPSVSACDPADEISESSENAVSLLDEMIAYLDAPMSFVLIKGLIFPVVYILTLNSSIKSIAALCGVDVDVSAISRLM